MEQGHKPLLFFQFGDPQLGLGLDHATTGGDIKRLMFAVEHVNGLFPRDDKVMIMVGDQIQWRTHGITPPPTTELDGIRLAMETWNGSVLTVPGNHDVWDPESREIYLQTYGVERSYGTFDAAGPGKATFLLLDTTSMDQKYKGSNFEFWKEEEEHARLQWAWFEGELERCKREGRVVVLVGHYPPFLYDEAEEPSEYSLKERERMLELLKRHNINHYLAGHVHETIHGRAKGLNLHTWIVAGTAMAEDEDTNGYGVRAFELLPPQPTQPTTLPSPVETYTTPSYTLHTSWIRLPLPPELIPPSSREIREKNRGSKPRRSVPS